MDVRFQAVAKEREKAYTRQIECREQTLLNLRQLIERVEICLEELKDKNTVGLDLNELNDYVKQVSKPLISHHRQLYGAVSKLSKSIDKHFQTDLKILANPYVFENKKENLNKTLAEHLFRQGRFEIAETFITESGTKFDSKGKAPFLKMYWIVEAFKKKNLDPVLSWISENKDALKKINSDFEFKVHQLKYIWLMTTEKDVQKSLAYAKIHFYRFLPSHSREIQKLMGALIYFGRLEQSPYQYMTQDSSWTDMSVRFTRDYCRLLGLSVESPLATTVTLGTRAIPKLLKTLSVMKNNTRFWTQTDKLPLELELEEQNQHHSLFVCPVSRELATGENPPVMLPCGHVIARNSLTLLIKTNKFKCPYCPSIESEAVKVIF
ncbi:E3 ubiquitin-protein ligase RMND5A-like [Zophobas morio]|jgi:hypothetical protein|uniref:E3 ubiquitin-protein ligase RMND5A-like n=1 Tax=Zophobas morio TaxID=2755281 RepID=UPI0030833B02